MGEGCCIVFVVRRTPGKMLTNMTRLSQKFYFSNVVAFGQNELQLHHKELVMAIDRHNMFLLQYFKTHITGRIWLPYYSNNQ